MNELPVVSSTSTSLVLEGDSSLTSPYSLDLVIDVVEIVQ
jgi:hypothetical protein